MNEKQFLERVRAGEFLAIGEYRHSKTEMIQWRDKQTGRAMTAPILRHTVEFGDSNSVAVSERLPQSIEKLEDVPKPIFKKGQTVVLVIDQLERNLGVVSARGKLEQLELSASPGHGQPVGDAAGVKR